MPSFAVVARHYPDLEPDYDGPALSLDAQIEGVTREFPVYYGTRAEAQKTLDWLKTGVDPSFCRADDTLEIIEVGEGGVYI